MHDSVKKMYLIKLLFVMLSFLYCFMCEDVLPEGSPCWVDEKRNGTCVNLYRCRPAAITYLYTKVGLTNVPPMPPVCSFRPDGEPIVCCTDCSHDNTEKLKRYVVMPRGYFRVKAGRKAWTKCGEYFEKLPYSCRGLTNIEVELQWQEDKQCDWMSFSESAGFGGENARENEFPHMALLGYGSDRESAQWLCGGTVISDRFILTAAHCASTPTLGPIAYAGLNVLKRRDVTDYWKVYKIISIIIHPEYKSPSKYHDIALIKTQNEINFGKGILPACLTTSGRIRNKGQAPGWGRIGHKGNLADHLQVMSLEVYNDTECAAMFPPHRLLKQGFDSKTQMCYGGRKKVVDTCQGDSGGPLHTDDVDCLYFVFGVTSFGKNCGIPGNVGVYTKLSYYLPWIENIVWPDEETTSD